MDISQGYIDILIQRCLDRTATVEERNTLLRVLKYVEDEEIEAKIVQAFYSTQVTTDPSEVIWPAILAKTVNSKVQKHYIGRRFKSILKYAAVVAFMLLIPFYFHRESLFHAFNQVYSVKDIDTVVPLQGIVSQVADAAHVELVLSSGAKIDLQNLDTTILSQEGNIEVIQDNDRIRYRYTGNPDHIAMVKDIYHTLKVPYGKRMSVQLLDGSIVYLNSGTELRYPLRSSSAHMDVYLRGEAFFDVAKSKERIFDVHVVGDQRKKGYTVQVLGTQFNIKAFEGELNSKATLLEGSIQVLGIADKPILLAPSQEISVGEGFSIAAADMDAAIAWRDNIFYFKQFPLSEVSLELERWYGVTIHCPSNVAGKKVLAQVSRGKTLQQVLDMLSQTQDIKYKIRGKEVYFME